METHGARGWADLLAARAALAAILAGVLVDQVAAHDGKRGPQPVDLGNGTAQERLLVRPTSRLAGKRLRHAHCRTDTRTTPRA